MLLTAAKNRGRRCALLGLACSAVLVIVGCGNGRVPVTGTVLFEGRPVEEGMITLEPVDGQGPTTGGMITAGKYDLRGQASATVGEKIVRIVALRKTGRKIAAGSPAPAGTMVDEVIQCIPKQFNDESTLRIQVTAGRSNTHEFDLKPDGTKR
jgi:hypothetical protein